MQAHSKFAAELKTFTTLSFSLFLTLIFFLLAPRKCIHVCVCAGRVLMYSWVSVCAVRLFPLAKQWNFICDITPHCPSTRRLSFHFWPCCYCIFIVCYLLWHFCSVTIFSWATDRRRCCYLLPNNNKNIGHTHRQNKWNPLTFQINWLNFMTLHHATAAAAGNNNQISTLFERFFGAWTFSQKAFYWGLNGVYAQRKKVHKSLITSLKPKFYWFRVTSRCTF